VRVRVGVGDCVRASVRGCVHASAYKPAKCVCSSVYMHP